MKIDPASLMDGFHDKSWNVQNTIRGLPGVIIIMLKNQHDDGSPLWSRVAFADKVFKHDTVEEWIKSKSRAGLGMSLGYLFNMLAAHDDLMGAGSADEARELLAQFGITALTATVKDAPTRVGQGKRLDNVKRLAGGNSSEYLAAVLKEKHPAIASALQRGEYRSIRAAAIAAGIVKVKSPLDHLLHWWARCGEQERAVFLSKVTP